jgi:hypothetical protein
MTTDSPKRAKFLPVPDKPEQRRDRDAVQVQDTQMQKLRDYFARPIPASAADDPAYLRKPHPLRQKLDGIAEHPFMRQLRELREKREANE